MSMPVTWRDLEAYQRCCSTHSRSCSSPSARAISSGVISTRSLILVLLLLDQLEPEEPARPKGQQVRQLADPREPRSAEQLNRITPFVGTEVELDRLRGPRDIMDAQNQIVLESAQMGEDPGVRGLDRLVRPEAEHRVLLAQRDEAMEPAQLRCGGAELRLDVDRLESVRGPS